jgi:four helix bundle protein
MDDKHDHDFNNKYCIRTKKLAIAICKEFNSIQTKESTRIVVRQILRSATSVAANFRAASRARSRAEYYSKICIVVEECDETIFWLEILKEADLYPQGRLLDKMVESEELLKIFSTTKKRLRDKMP